MAIEMSCLKVVEFNNQSVPHYKKYFGLLNNKYIFLVFK